jgi:hypothetical protein
LRRGLFTVGFLAPSRSGADRWTSDISEGLANWGPSRKADQIALSFPFIHAASNWWELFDSELPETLHRRFRAVLGITNESRCLFADRICGTLRTLITFGIRVLTSEASGPSIFPWPTR